FGAWRNPSSISSWWGTTSAFTADRVLMGSSPRPSLCRRIPPCRSSSPSISWLCGTRWRWPDSCLRSPSSRQAGCFLGWARLGGGDLPMFVSPRRFRDSVGKIADMAASANRRLVLGPALSVWCGLDADYGRARALLGRALERLYALPYEEFRNLTFAGSPR